MSTQVLGYLSGSSHSSQSTANSGRPVPLSKPPRRVEVEARGQVAIDKLKEFAAEKQALQQQNASLDNEIKVIRQERAECRQKIEEALKQKSALEAREQQVDAIIAARQENLAKTQENLAKTQENLAKTQARRTELAEEMKETQVQKSTALATQQMLQEKRSQYLGNLKTMQRVINEQTAIVNNLSHTNQNKSQLLEDLESLNKRGISIETEISAAKFEVFLPKLKQLNIDLKEIREKVSLAKN